MNVMAEPIPAMVKHRLDYPGHTDLLLKGLHPENIEALAREFGGRRGQVYRSIWRGLYVLRVFRG